MGRPSTATEPGARGRWWVAIVAGMASYLDAASITAFGTALVIFQDVLDLTDVQVGLAAGTLAASVAAGAVVGGPLGDRYGRKPVFMTTMVLIIAGGGALLVGAGFELVVVGVAVLGLGVGADLPVSLATIAESATSRDRGRLVAFSNLLWLLGIISTFAISAVVGDLGRTAVLVLFGHIVVVATAVLVARASLPESEVWRAARAARLTGGTGVTGDRPPRVRVADLVAPAYRAPFLGLMAFLALTSVAASVAGQYGTYIAVTYADLSVATASLISLAAVPLVLVGYLWFMRIADTDRRFTYFRLGAVALVVGPAVLAVLGVSLPTLLVGTLVQAVGGAFAFEGIFKVWAQRSFPTLLRTTAQGLVIGVQRVTSALAVAVVPVTLTAVGPHAFYAILTVTSATGVGVAWAVFRTRDAHDELALDIRPSQGAAPAVSLAPTKTQERHRAAVDQLQQ